MNITTKIHSFKHYLKYAVNSKTKYKVHSPFVYSFITNILEPENKNSLILPQQIQNYYRDSQIVLSLKENQGEGSQVFDSSNIRATRIINKVGIPPKYGKVLNSMVRQYEVLKVIELGTSLGMSSAFLLSDNDLHLTTVEANEVMVEASKKAFNENGYSKQINFIHAKFDEVLEDLCLQGLEQTLIFIDGDHNKESVLRYFKCCLPYTKSSTILVFDDIYWSEGMTEAWHEICKHKDVKLSIDMYRMGLVFFRQATKEKEHFQIWY